MSTSINFIQVPILNSGETTSSAEAKPKIKRIIKQVPKRFLIREDLYFSLWDIFYSIALKEPIAITDYKAREQADKELARFVGYFHPLHEKDMVGSGSNICAKKLKEQNDRYSQGIDRYLTTGILQVWNGKTCTWSSNREDGTYCYAKGKEAKAKTYRLSQKVYFTANKYDYLNKKKVWKTFLYERRQTADYFSQWADAELIAKIASEHLDFSAYYNEELILEMRESFSNPEKYLLHDSNRVYCPTTEFKTEYLAVKIKGAGETKQLDLSATFLSLLFNIHKLDRNLVDKLFIESCEKALKKLKSDNLLGDKQEINRLNDFLARKNIMDKMDFLSELDTRINVYRRSGEYGIYQSCLTEGGDMYKYICSKEGLDIEKYRRRIKKKVTTEINKPSSWIKQSYLQKYFPNLNNAINKIKSVSHNVIYYFLTALECRIIQPAMKELREGDIFTLSKHDCIIYNSEYECVVIDKVEKHIGVMGIRINYKVKSLTGEQNKVSKFVKKYNIQCISKFKEISNNNNKYKHINNNIKHYNKYNSSLICCVSNVIDYINNTKNIEKYISINITNNTDKSDTKSNNTINNPINTSNNTKTTRDIETYTDQKNNTLYTTSIEQEKNHNNISNKRLGFEKEYALYDFYRKKYDLP